MEKCFTGSLSEGPNHPNLTDAKSPSTSHCIAANRKRTMGKAARSLEYGESSSSSGPTPPRRQKLTNREVGNFVVKHDIRTYTELLAISDEREEAGELDLSEFIYKSREEWLKALIKKAWDKAGARQEVEALKNHDRLDILIKAKTETPCV